MSRYHLRPIVNGFDTTPTFHNTLGTTVTNPIPLIRDKRITVDPSTKGMDTIHGCPKGKNTEKNSHPYRHRKNTVTITTGTEDRRKRHTAQDMHRGIHGNSQGMGQALPTLQELRCGQILSETEPHLGSLLADIPPRALQEGNPGMLRTTPQSRQLAMGGTHQAAS